MCQFETFVDFMFEIPLIKPCPVSIDFQAVISRVLEKFSIEIK